MILKIAIAGAGGRMGRTLIETVTQAAGCELHAALEHAGSPLLGTSAAALVPGAGHFFHGKLIELKEIVKAEIRGGMSRPGA